MPAEGRLAVSRSIFSPRCLDFVRAPVAKRAPGRSEAVLENGKNGYRAAISRGSFDAFFRFGGHPSRMPTDRIGSSGRESTRSDLDRLDEPTVEPPAGGAQTALTVCEGRGRPALRRFGDRQILARSYTLRHALVPKTLGDQS